MRVVLFSPPADANERLSLYQTLLAAESPDIDVFQIDVVWPGSLASHFVDLRDYIPAAALNGHYDLLLTNNTVENSLVAAPWFVDVGLVYYPKDLLDKHGPAVPDTCRDLTEGARAVVPYGRAAGDPHMLGLVGTGRASRVL